MGEGVCYGELMLLDSAHDLLRVLKPTVFVFVIVSIVSMSCKEDLKQCWHLLSNSTATLLTNNRVSLAPFRYLMASLAPSSSRPR